MKRIQSDAGPVAGLEPAAAAAVDTVKEAQPNAEDPGHRARLINLADDLRCLVCQNESLAGSHAELAEDLRREIREQMKAGKDDQEVVAYLTERYGDFVLYRPPFKPVTWLLWLGPVLFLGIGGGAWYMTLRRRRAAQNLPSTRRNSPPPPNFWKKTNEPVLDRLPVLDCRCRLRRHCPGLCAAPAACARGRRKQGRRRDVNIAVYRDQMKEMEADRERPAFRRAVPDRQTGTRSPPGGRCAGAGYDAPNPARSAAASWAMPSPRCMPVAAFGLYFCWGSRNR
jgi:cytochrome c-type biogenesis protein CcmH